MASDTPSSAPELLDTPEVQPTKAESYFFGAYRIDESEVFLTTRLSFAFVNYKPVVPGHVLVSPKRVVKRVVDLTSEEITDMFLTAQRISRKLEAHHEATSLSFGIQDGKEAGQTVNHVHIHILPRKAIDFKKNDDEAKDEIDEKETMSGKLDANKSSKPRTAEDMAREADLLRALFVVDATGPKS